MFSQTTEYALRIMVCLADLDEPTTIPQLAQMTKVPEGYLAKVLRSLSRSGLLSSRRGLHGGSVLARPAHAISIYDVIQAVDPMQRIRTCPLGLKSHGATLCALHRRMDEALRMVEDACRASTLAELLAENSPSKPLCDTSAIRRVVKLHSHKTAHH